MFFGTMRIVFFSQKASSFSDGSVSGVKVLILA